MLLDFVKPLVCSLIVTILLSEVAFAQHDGARDAVREIAKGRFQNVERLLQDKDPDAGKAEAAFVRMLSLLAQDRIDDALRQAKLAVREGLSFERLLAGPREQLTKLHANSEFQQWSKESKPSLLVHGPMVGRVTDTTASIWVRTTRAINVLIRLEGGALQAQHRTTRQASDFTCVAKFDYLTADTQYRYDVVEFAHDRAGKVLGSGQFRTFPAQGEFCKFRIGFGGGAGYVPEWERMWDTIDSFEPNAFLMLGDNVYIDEPKTTLRQHYCYYRRQSRPEWKRLTSHVPIFSIWDDHDFGTDDCIPGPEIETPKWKRHVWNVFRQNWINPAYGGGEAHPGCWYDFIIGDVHFIMLDGRYYRDLSAGSMLGPVQKQWLFQTLTRSTGTFKVIASPVPFTTGVKKGSRDPWDGFPEEREEIFRHIEKNKIEGVLLVAADRHRTDLRVTKRKAGYDLYEFESSRLTNRISHPVVVTPGLLWGYNEKCSFALMDFDSTVDVPTVTFRCVNIDGEEIHQQTVARSQLNFD